MKRKSSILRGRKIPRGKSHVHGVSSLTGLAYEAPFTPPNSQFKGGETKGFFLFSPRPSTILTCWTGYSHPSGQDDTNILYAV